MDESLTDLTVLLREDERPPDEKFVSEVEWLIDLDIRFERRRRAMLRRWLIDLGSACAVGAVAHMLARDIPTGLTDLPMIFSTPLLAATAVPILWLLARSSPAAA